MTHWASRLSEKRTNTLGLFGCARTTLVDTGDPKISLVFPPGGFIRGRGWAVPESSKIPLSFPPERQLLHFFPDDLDLHYIKKIARIQTSRPLLSRNILPEGNGWNPLLQELRVSDSQLYSLQLTDDRILEQKQLHHFLGPNFTKCTHFVKTHNIKR